MCNEAYRRIQLGEIRQDISQLRIPLRFPEGTPNFPDLESIRITDRLEIIRRSVEEPGSWDMVTRRWSWPGSHGKPIYNIRSDGKSFGEGEGYGRCLIPVEGFYEFTAPPPPDPDAPKPAKKPLKSKWAFSMVGRRWFCIAGVWRRHTEVGEGWSMLTCPPGPDVAPYHGRQVVVLGPDDWARWLDPATPSLSMTVPPPPGTLEVRQVR